MFYVRNYKSMKRSRTKVKQNRDLRDSCKDVQEARQVILFRNMSLQKSSVIVGNSSSKIHSLTPNKQKESPIKMQAMETIVEKKPKKKKKQKQKKRKQNYEVCLKQIKPINLEKEKQIFFKLSANYSPFFIYANISQITEHDKQYKGMDKPHQKYLGLAISILQRSIALNYVQKLTSSPLLTQQETCLAFDQYIQYLGIENTLKYEFMENTVAPTSVIHNNSQGISRVVIGKPIQYRKVSVMGVLNHEIGTHFIRKYNNRLQKWHKDRKKYGLDAYLKYEEGLAAVNQLFEVASREQIIPPMLFQAALHYYSCYNASKMSFAQLYADLAKFYRDPQMRWRECVRVKRGIANTATQQGMYKDQIYLRGAVRILKNRKEINFIDMHCGKLTVKDCMRLNKQFNYTGIKLPYFLNDLEHYSRVLDRIAKQNKIDQWFQYLGGMTEL